MTYYILPRSHNLLEIKPSKLDIEPYTYATHSVYYHCSKLQVQLNKYNNNAFTIEEKMEMLQANSYNELMEICTSLNLFNDVYIQKMISLHAGNACMDSKNCLITIREENAHSSTVDYISLFETIHHEPLFTITNDFRYHYIYLGGGGDSASISLEKYILNLCKSLMIILKYQEVGGFCVFKFDHMFHKAVLDIVYILSGIFEKVYIIKPTTSDPTSFDRYVVCKKFLFDDYRKQQYKDYYFELGKFMNEIMREKQLYFISQILDMELPNLFINKINDINVILGQQQIDTMINHINILKSKNISVERKKKCLNVSWGEKVKSPVKSTNSNNMFLQTDKKDSNSNGVEKNCFLQQQKNGNK